MREGFSFDGVDLADVGLSYAPDIQETYVYHPAVSNVHIESFEGHDGGYMYGSWKEPKEFILRCVFEEQRIDAGIMTKIHNLFRIGRTGKLIFKRRPWCYYIATVTEVDDRELSNYLNGLITIKMQSMYPFARCDNVYGLRNTIWFENMMQNSALYDTQGYAPQTEFANLTSKTSIIIGNPGTERAAVNIAIAGDAMDGVIIANKTTGQEIKMVGLSKSATTNAGKEVYVNGINGKTVIRSNGTSQIAFIYHDYGFIELDPAFPATRNIYISYSSGNTVHVNNILTDNYVGQYIYVSGAWRKINAQDKHELNVTPGISTSGQEKTTIMKMNEITVTPVSTMNLSKLSFEFKPTFS